MNRTTPDVGRPGWLIVRTDATIVAADDIACALLRAPGPEGLAGRNWTSLVSHADGDVLTEVRAALAAGSAWRGLLRFSYGIDAVTLLVEVVPAEQSAGVMLLRLDAAPSAPPVPPIPAPPSATFPSAEDTRTGLAALEALEALEALRDPAAAARAVLQALHGVVAYDWGAVLRYHHHPNGDAAATAEVLAVYPSPMAGIAAGVTWSPLDTAEAGVLSSGEPELAGDIRRDRNEHSPLARLPAFGMRSRLHLPLFAGGIVAGDLVVYATAAHALGSAEGVRLERITRALGERLDGAALSPPPLPQPAPSMPAPSLPAPVAIEAEPMPRPAHVPPAPPTPQEPIADDSERLSVLGELVSGVAHELNNPLTSILGYAQIFNTLDGEERANAVSTIEQEAQRAARIVRNLLSFARQEPHRSSEVDLEAVLRRVIEVRRYSLEVDNVRVTTRFEGIPQVMADEAQFEGVLLNLINNAQQALQPGGGEIVVSTSMAGEYVRLSIADNGPGVPEEVRSRIFEPFFTTRGVGDGQGMGLAAVYGVVAEHGGRVWVEESSAGGAEFVIELPLRRRSTPPAGGERPRTAGVGGSERILVVDDEAPIRALTAEILGAAGYRVTTASGGDEALEHLATETYDLVVTDMRMPGMDGATLYEHIGNQWPDLQRRMLFITGDVEGERTNRRLARGDVRYLEKPFDMGALLRAIRARLDDAPAEAGPSL